MNKLLVTLSGLFILNGLPSLTRAQQNCVGNNPSTLAANCTSISNTSCGQFYSYSTFPNNLTRTLDVAINRLNGYRPLYSEFNCSIYSHVYVCLSIMPPCDPNTGGPAAHHGPCNSICNRVNDTCFSSVLSTFIDFIGAGDLDCLFSNCSRFPSQNCVGINDPIVQQIFITPTTPPSTNTFSSSCPLPNNTFFTDSSKSFTLGWISFWSVICFISTAVTIFTFLLDTSRFEYPWRPVIYLSLSFNIHSLSYFFSAALGRNIVTCPNGVFVRSGMSWTWAHAPCLLVFIFLYYSMMAAFLWWVILAISWFLVSALQWSHEAVSKISPFYHCVAWILPLLMTICLLAARVVGADELTATCFVVNNGTMPSFLALLIGVILPLIALLITGTVLLFLGFVGVVRIRSFMQKGGKQEEKQILEKLMIRIGIFVAVYIIPAAVLIGCFIYELASRSNWQSLSECSSNCSRPNSAVFIIRIFMFLLIGALTGVWIWSRKTLSSWKDLPDRCVIARCFRPPVESRQPPHTPSAEKVLPHGMPSMAYSYPDSGLDSI